MNPDVHYVTEHHLLNDLTACGRRSTSAATGTTHPALVTCEDCSEALRLRG